MIEAVVVQGGLRIGDTLHLTWLFNRLRKFTKVTWHCGRYHWEAVKLLCLRFPNIEAIPHKEPVPPADLRSIAAFREQVEKTIEKPIKELYFADDTLHCRAWTDPTANNRLPSLNKPRKKRIIIHSDSYLGYWKASEALLAFRDWPEGYELIVVQWQENERTPPILPSMSIWRNPRLWLLAEVIEQSACVVGIHSSVACLTSHLSTPLLVPSFTDDSAVIHFSKIDKELPIIQLPALHSETDIGNALRDLLEGRDLVNYESIVA